MDILNFSSYAHAIEKGIANPKQIEIIQMLLGFIVNKPDVLNKNGDQYNLDDNQTLNRWWKQTEELPKNIKDAAVRADIIAEANDYFDAEVWPKLNPPKEEDTYEELLSLIKQQDMADITKEKLISLYNNEELSEFLAQTFLYAIQNKNKVKSKIQLKQPLALAEDIQKLQDILSHYPKPVILTPPSDLNDHEMIYVEELFAAYADAEGMEDFTRDDLDTYIKYKKNFSNQRKRYYAAESIRQSIRDTLLPEEYKNFEELKQETLIGILPVHEQDYKTGYDRLNNVMAHATVINVTKSMLATLPGWIGNNEKMGICHMLVNDREIRWVDDDNE